MGFGLPGWPGGDPDLLEETAQAWDDLADAMSDITDEVDRQVRTQLGHLKGLATTAFLEAWSTYVDGQRELVRGVREAAEKVRKVAEAIRGAHTKYKHIVAGLAGATVAAVVIGAFTFGIGGAAEETAAVGAAAAAIAGVLEGLGLAVSEELAATVIAEAMVQATVGAEFSTLLQVGGSLGAGEGIKVDWGKVALAAGAGGAFGGVLGAASDVGLLGKAGLGALVTTGSAVVDSEIEEGRLPSLSDAIAAALLGAVAGGLEHQLGKTKQEIAQLLAAQRNEAGLAADFAVLFKHDPTMLKAIQADRFQSDEVRYLAMQYDQLFRQDATLLDDVPSLALFLRDQPSAVTRVTYLNTRLMEVVHAEHLPPSLARQFWTTLARDSHANWTKATNEGLTDFVKDWAEKHKELIEELEAVP